uniref:Reverse transcriptase domain-containing protein n=1 Tax=Panagrellus redivivus TaxID=6233 RepID=A0A7E4WAP6_PANRE
MLEDVGKALNKIGLEINKDKTKWMSNEPRTTTTELTLNGKVIERVQHFVYLGKLIGFRRPKVPATAAFKEISRRISSGWLVFNKMKTLMRKNNVPMQLKRRFHDQCVLPAMLYAAETWALTKSDKERLMVAQRNMERCMLGITRRNMEHNESIRRKTAVKDCIQSARKVKFAARVTSDADKWTARITNWTPPSKRPVGMARLDI